jgi:hypothetical protein
MPAKITTPERRGIYLLTHPRSASNLFQTMLAKQPGFQNSGYKLFDAGFAALGQMQRGPLSEWDEKEREGLYDVFRKGWESLEDEVEDAGRNVSIYFLLLSEEGEEGGGRRRGKGKRWESYTSTTVA